MIDDNLIAAQLQRIADEAPDAGTWRESLRLMHVDGIKALDKISERVRERVARHVVASALSGEDPIETAQDLAAMSYVVGFELGVRCARFERTAEGSK